MGLPMELEPHWEIGCLMKVMAANEKFFLLVFVDWHHSIAIKCTYLPTEYLMLLNIVKTIFYTSKHLESVSC